MKDALPISESILTIERLRSVLSYDIVSGFLTWNIKPNRNIRIGNRAGSLKSDGYRYVRVDNIEYLEHRLIWFGMTGE